MSTTNELSQGAASNDKPMGDGEQPAGPTAWVIRAGRHGEQYDNNIEHGVAGIHFGQFLDLSAISSRDELKDAIRSHDRDVGDRSISNRAGQLWRMRADVRVGDLVVMPHKTEPHVALGTVTREYAYVGDDPDSAWPHVVSVDWRRPQLPWTAIKEDLRSSLSAQQSIFQITRHDGSWRFQQLLETGRDPGARAYIEDEASDLFMLVEQFYGETGYPTDAHIEQERLREEWARKLSEENVASLSREDLLAYTTNAVDYGQYVDRGEGRRHQWIIDLDDAGYDRLLDSIRDLCWSEDELSTRIDRLVDPKGGFNRDTGTKGFSGIQVSRTLAICFPEQFLPFPSQIGIWGRESALRVLGLPETRGSYGQRVVEANDRLREHLAPHFDDDPQAIACFLNWLREQVTESSDSPTDSAELAAELLVGVEFLDDIVSLLKDKGQVILYGPPGTGKTYLARKLAKVLAPDDSCRALVQFHPSTSYEDFFEGYRPAGTGDDGGIRYKLTPGPLARIAERASESSERHVMIIDEINRGNLPRVLGELLFLLEYRDEEVETLYRTGERFSLPDNLWFIGTMNTADRSIALVDAALRRRFHFVPFFPDSGPMAGLLDRWLAAEEDRPAWVGSLVEAVNRELKEVLEGSHLLLGPSHFMKAYGSSLEEQRQQLRRIWEYNIEPFIEDQFFGDPNRIEHFRFDAVMRRNGPAAESDVHAGDDPESTEDSEAEHAAAAGEAAAEPSPAQPADER